MIDINSEHLDTLRTPMKTATATSDLTKQEIRTLEGKLIKHFSQQLAMRAAFPGSAQMFPALEKYPSLSQWLMVVGITAESKRAIASRVNTLEQLKEKTDSGENL